MRRGGYVPCLEYKSADGAWYEVSLKLENDKLIIHFEGDFAGARDEEFSLENVKDLQELEAAFRLPSRQLIDKECEKVTPGMVVCASHTGVDRRTFDARVEKVTGSKVKHISVDGEEQCNCIYEVLWLAGPYERERTSIYCENIYLLQSKKIQSHPVIKGVVIYLENRKDYKSQVAVENSSQTNTEKIGDTISRPLNSQVTILSENTVRIMNSCWPVGARQVIDIEEESGELKSTPTNLKETEDLEEGFNHKLNIKSNILQKLFSNDDKPECLVQHMIYGIPGNCVLNGEDTDSNLCSPKQENSRTVAAVCKSEGDFSERDLSACMHSLMGDAKGGSGGWIDDDSPSLGKNCDGNVVGNSDSDCPHFSTTGDADLVNRNKEFSEDWSARLGNCNKSPSHVIIEDESADMQKTDIVIVCPSNMKVQRNLDLAKNEGVMNACTVFSEGRSEEPKFTSKFANNSSIQNCGRNTGCEPCLTLKKRKDPFSSDFYACEDIKNDKVKKSGMDVDVCISDSMGKPQRKQPRDDNSNSVKNKIKENISCEKEPGDMVKNSDALVKAELQCKYVHHSPTGLHGFHADLSHDGYKHHCYFKNCCPCCTHFHLSHEYCAECVRYICGVVGKAPHYSSQVVCTGCCPFSLKQAVEQISMNFCQPRREEEFQDQHNLFSSSHVILLENLDKDVNPSDVLSIIQQAGVDFVKVYVSPPQGFQNFTRGIVCFEDQENFQRVSAYLQNENIIVTSSNGRPWVVIDAGNGLSEGSFGGFTTGPKCYEVSSNKVQICRRGTPEYESAKKLRDKFLEWWEHVKLLHQALANKETAL
ncbi:uncharacterized protein LOC131066363 isoform X1 [Cryptomeria japonica]|uniref:uncharacterized protein LOC131066363 isoform X1 n=1 Tax=Cryptomeria japonica TaxID=3369 RepID=UPI0027DA60B9|nr:uncharacterized protein LOC131066363 isoform X1 [Cryptomeria japonica]